MILTYSEKDGKSGMFVAENKSNIRNTKSGNGVSFLITESANILVNKDGKSKTITGKQLIAKVFGK